MYEHEVVINEFAQGLRPLSAGVAWFAGLTEAQQRFVLFRSDDGTVVDPDATIDSSLPVGSTVALRRTASAGYEQTGVGASFGWLALTLLGLMVLVLGTLLVRVRAGARGRPRALLVLLGVLGAVMLLSAFIGGVAGMVGAF
jgi:hypothetical protein